ncbi:MAG: transporter substrate-binding domain-containing protein [Alphaproteobacteria bacterium]|nr:transporter substrate-binding domain-containing protein [Alphaproteobacteria bacterium]
MRKFLFYFFCFFTIYNLLIWDTQAAEKKQTSMAKNQQQILEEENRGNKKNKKIQTNIICGYINPLRVASFITNAPFGWVNVTPPKPGKKLFQYQSAGFAYDLFEDLAKQLNFKVENTAYTSYRDAIRDLRLGKIDVVAGSYFDKRSLGAGVNVLFPGYISNPIRVLFLKGKERPVDSWDDLSGLKGVVRQEENIYSVIFNQLPKDAQIEQISGSKNAFKKLLTGDVDYLITSTYAAEAEILRFKISDQISIAPKVLASPELFFVFSSHSDCYRLKNLFSNVLKKMKQDEVDYMNRFRSYIDGWGKRFQEVPGLIDEMNQAELNAVKVNVGLSVDVGSDIADIQEPNFQVSVPKEKVPQAIDKKQKKLTTKESKKDTALPAKTQNETNRPLTPAERIQQFQ